MYESTGILTYGALLMLRLARLSGNTSFPPRLVPSLCVSISMSTNLCLLLSLSFRLELILPRGGVSHADPPSPLVSIIRTSVSFCTSVTVPLYNHYLCPSISLSPPVCLSLPLPVYLFQSVCSSVSPFPTVYPTYPCLSISVPPSSPVGLSLRLSLSLPVRLSPSVSPCPSAHPSDRVCLSQHITEANASRI